ncbi:MAG: DNA/RNA helicase domain-containing protein [Metamycoplasmataceae bacterium]
MIVYENEKNAFIEDVRLNRISDKIKENMLNLGIPGGGTSEVKSWINSMNFMSNAIDSVKISNDTYIAIEYKIPYSNKRIDFMVLGHDDKNIKNYMIVELKQWENAEDTNKNDIVKTYTGNGLREVAHPSYQAYEYYYLMQEFNKSVRDENINGYSCAYLHNMEKNKNFNLVNKIIYSYVNNHPIFFKNDVEKLQEKIISLVGKGRGKEILYTIENSEIVPSKKLINTIKDTLKGKESFKMIGNQKLIFENILSYSNSQDNVFIINGNPGTGKSVVAINLLSNLLSLKKKVLYVAPNAAFKNSILESLKENKNNGVFDVLIKGSSGLWNVEKDLYDWIIIDEAHRLKNKGTYMYKGENQIEDMIKASKNTIFFIDEKQIIRKNDIGTNENISKIANEYNKKIFHGGDFILETQFRCSGADGYINALDTTLQLEKETGNFYLNENRDYDFKICDTPQEMNDLINKRIQEGNKNSRIVAGFAWPWITKKMSLDNLAINKDIKIQEFDYEIAWNYNDSKMLWALKDDKGIPQAGCVHTCQGLEFDYCGVIIGNDIKIDDENNLYGDYDEYFDMAGKKGLKNDLEQLTKLIKNIYKILLSRGQKGTYVFIRNPKVKEYFLKHIKNN